MKYYVPPVQTEGVQTHHSMSEHFVNTTSLELASHGMNHTEGAWPEEIDPASSEQTEALRTQIEQDDSFVEQILEKAEDAEKFLVQNMTLDIYSRSFEDDDEDYLPEEPKLIPVTYIKYAYLWSFNC